MLSYQNLINRLPGKYKNFYRHCFRETKIIKRILPDFIIIGAQRCGTTSLYKYISEHPSILSNWRKEVHFFNVSYSKGLIWYKSFFPTSIYVNCLKYLKRRNFITFEASPSYFETPHVSRRIYSTLPNIKLIILLRNPIDRAYSNYYHEVRRGNELLSFEEAIEKEPEKIEGEFNKMLKNENYYSYKFLTHGYLTKGIYVNYIKDWYQYFSKEQILIIRSEDFFENPKKVLENVFKFLELPEFRNRNYKKFNEGKYPPMNIETRSRLNEYFKPYNRALYEYLGINFNWDY